MQMRRCLQAGFLLGKRTLGSCVTWVASDARNRKVMTYGQLVRAR